MALPSTTDLRPQNREEILPSTEISNCPQSIDDLNTCKKVFYVIKDRLSIEDLLNGLLTINVLYIL